MVAALNFEPHLVHRHAHGITQIGLLIDRGDREITALDRGLITKVAAFFLAAGVPVCLIGINRIEHRIGLYLVTDVLKDEELSFGSKNAVSAIPVDFRYSSARSATPRGSR